MREKQSQLSLYRGQGNNFLRINPDIELWWEEDRIRASRWTPQWR